MKRWMRPCHDAVERPPRHSSAKPTLMSGASAAAGIVEIECLVGVIDCAFAESGRGAGIDY